MHHEITISVAQNCVEFGGGKYQYTHRWECSLLAAFSLLRANNQASAVTNDALPAVLSMLGQGVPLNRKQLSRLFDSVETGLLAVGLDATPSNVQTLPRKQNVVVETCSSEFCIHAKFDIYLG